MDQLNSAIQSLLRLMGRGLEERNRDNGSVATVITKPRFCCVGSTTVLTGMRPFLPVLISTHTFGTPSSVVAVLHHKLAPVIDRGVRLSSWFDHAGGSPTKTSVSLLQLSLNPPNTVVVTGKRTIVPLRDMKTGLAQLSSVSN